MVTKEKNRKEYLFSCDVAGCSNQESFDGTNGFPEAVQEAKAKGWLARNQEGLWVHRCPAHDRKKGA